MKVLVDLDAPGTASPPSRKRYQYLPYRYDVAGVVRIGSQIMLPELEFFRAQWVADGDVDIAVRVGDVGRGPRRRASMTEYANQNVIRYEEHLGRLGANFRIELGTTINIEVGPLLAASPHVVYTNIVEALLRFVMVARGRMLLHSATVNLGGTGVMLSALTDTGKTATVLRLLRDHGGLFLSDDMTVIDADGTAVCFPKPLTISAHTLRAVQAGDIPASPALSQRRAVIDVAELILRIQLTGFVGADRTHQVPWHAEAPRRRVTAQTVRLAGELRLARGKLFDAVEDRAKLRIDRAQFHDWCARNVAEIHIVVEVDRPRILRRDIGALERSLREDEHLRTRRHLQRAEQCRQPTPLVVELQFRFRRIEPLLQVRDRIARDRRAVADGRLVVRHQVGRALEVLSAGDGDGRRGEAGD